MLNRPVELMSCHERNLSPDEVGVLLRDALQLVQNYGTQGYNNPSLKDALQITSGSLICYFTRSEPGEANELIVLTPRCQNTDADLAILLANDSKHYYFRARAIDYEYRSDKFNSKSFRSRSDFVYLPLP